MLLCVAPGLETVNCRCLLLHVLVYADVFDVAAAALLHIVVHEYLCHSRLASQEHMVMCCDSTTAASGICASAHAAEEEPLSRDHM